MTTSDAATRFGEAIAVTKDAYASIEPLRNRQVRSDIMSLIDAMTVTVQDVIGSQDTIDDAVDALRMLQALAAGAIEFLPTLG